MRLTLCYLLAILVASGAIARESSLGTRHLRREHHYPPGRWVLAERLDLDAANAALPSQHAKVTEPYAKGLPHDCVTYEERYGPYMDKNDTHDNLNLEIPTAKHVAVMRVWAETVWSKDLILSTRALAHESYKSGWHFWLLHQEAYEEGTDVTTPADILNRIPPEFRPLVQSFTENQVHNMFPKAHTFRRGRGTDFSWRDYLQLVMFMDRFRAYEFIFLMESDVRYTGKSWGSLFNAVIHIASRALNNEEADNMLGHLSPTLLPADPTARPDLILFSEGLSHPVAVDADNLKDNRSWPFPNVIDSANTFFGFSRRMNDQLIKHSNQGSGGYLEQFVASVAFHEDVNTVLVSLGIYEEVVPLHCCIPATTRAYESWYVDKMCWDSVPMHPVKNDNVSIWGQAS